MTLIHWEFVGVGGHVIKGLGWSEHNPCGIATSKGIRYVHPTTFRLLKQMTNDHCYQVSFSICYAQAFEVSGPHSHILMNSDHYLVVDE
jgi:hypothetical protein